MPNIDNKHAVLLVNLGSPDSTSVADVRTYLREFLMDSRVLDAPYLVRKMIVELFILPFRPKNSAHAYQTIWWEEGSPLIVLSRRLQQQLQSRLNQPVELAMRYGNPSIETVIRDLIARQPGLQELYLVPLYPHYAMATYETVVVEVKDVLRRLNTDLVLTIKQPFFDEPGYIRALVDSTTEYLQQDYDHLLFSYHGIPERHCKKSDPTGSHCLKVDNCCSMPSPAHATCYRHQVLKATEAFVKVADIPKEKYSVAFQSRLGMDAWLSPATADELVRLAESGVKRLLVMCPAFVSDCLETLEEIGLQGKDSFLEAGGESFELIPCLNNHESWVGVLENWCEAETVSVTAEK